MKKKLLYILGALLLPLSALAVQVSVPSAPGVGYGLTSVSSGNYVASSTSPLIAGTGIGFTGVPYVFGSGTITNTAPDQTVVLNNGSGISVTGTYPTFTITNTAGGFAYPFPNNATTTTLSFLGGLTAFASSTIGNGIEGLTIHGNATTTGKLIVQGTATSTFAGDIDVGTNHIRAHGVYGDATDGFMIHASNGTQVANLGTGNSANSLFLGGVNIDGATRLATSLNGLLKATSGAVSAASAGTDYLTPAGIGSNLTLSRIGASTYSTVQDLQNVFHSAGWITGGTITNIDATHVSVAAGTGLIRDANSATATVYYFDWTASSSITVSTNAVIYLGVEYNGGSPRVTSRTTPNWNYRTDFPLGRVTNDTSTNYIANDVQGVGDHASTMIQREYETMPFAKDLRDGGLILSDSADNNRNIAVTAGAIWDRLNRYTLAASSTAYFDTYSGQTRQATLINVWPNTAFADGAGGLTTMSANKYANLWFYETVNGNFIMVYGTAQYNTLAEADLEGEPSTLPNRVIANGKLLARLQFQKSATIAAQVDLADTTTFSAAAATNHANLSNLSWTVSNHTGTANTVPYFDAGGAAVLFATSTLNIGGTASNITGLLAVSNGGTGSTTLSGILKGNGTSAIQTAINGTDFTLTSAQTCLNGSFISALTASGGSTCTASPAWFNPFINYNATSTPIGFLQGFFSTASSTINSTLTLTPLGTPAGTHLAVDATGKIIATTTPVTAGLTFNTNTLSQVENRSFTASSTNPTVWTSTSTMMLETGYGETWNYVKCRTDTGTAVVDFFYRVGGTITHLATYIASTTAGKIAIGSTVPVDATTTVAIGTPTGNMTQANCTVNDTI